ncbi:MAG: nicotinate (nicotinamide) nucleotide adenylyltransferase, partial [Pseudomonadota bacterium]|jgi:nicotinate-nucleotide adenylyltransferase|nr:nicotinate (nicotinamide) nucleotide adenylyltransferase [Alphaproteobacteria bacterium]MEC7577502.1 nicotinate (nicotinamide) nucleotide adenylyltransferase [Pseudomonadota bacterium]MCS5597142.1 nicotinate (nicotinamide) nucleotide adenylyltransferase [Alphaproteobacteria bacterium]MEC7701652.1 nicotinate (nicotinamide) nucleotide adenylyltransferase [Pseudomonadota bacterium]MED5422147.1 nicotinate (nicotinamide) nucleotide adenylyltransferase [Pseudomonadota bacterium]|tara:strand:+ start:323147 stop:323893 length:747 start_codon:yes stop_codon:yes gene_type:complete
MSTLAANFSKASTKKRVVLFGGSFNPPHEGHLHIAHKAYEAMGADEVWMLVAPRNPFKDPKIYADLSHRMEMSRLMTAHLPWMKVTDIEQQYIPAGEDFIETAETLKRLRADYPDHEFVWMMGSDNVIEFHKWGGWQDMVKNHIIMIMNRTQSTEEIEAVKKSKAITDSGLNVDMHVKGTKYTKQNGFYLVDSPVMELSSTMIRKNLAQKQPNIIGLFNSVADYIADEGLYDYGGAPKKPSGPKPKCP